MAVRINKMFIQASEIADACLPVFHIPLSLYAVIWCNVTNFMDGTDKNNFETHKFDAPN